MPSTMFGFTAKGRAAEDPEDIAIIDPSASIDPQTGYVIEKKSKEERKFVARLDVFLLIFVCISQVIKYLDQTNVSSVFRDNGWYRQHLADQHSICVWHEGGYFNIGYAIFLIPSQIIITRVRPSLWLPALELCWGLLTLGIFKATSAKQIYVLRAFLGVFEASAYPGAIMLLMAWYTPREIAFRIGFYHSCQTIGAMMASALQAAIQKGLDGHGGIAGWRWMFVIDSIVTLSIASAGVFLIPDFPSNPNPRAFWLKSRHVELAKERSKRFGRSDNKKFTLRTIKSTIRQPLFYFIGSLYPASVLAQQGYNYFNLWLKSLHHADGTLVWSKEALNAIPIGGYAITLVMVWGWSFISDYFQTRWLVVMAQAFIGLIPSIILSVWDVSNGAKYFSFFATYLSLATAPPIFAWLSDLSPHDAEQRAFILGWAIAFYYAMGAWSNILIWPASEAPHYKAGWKVSIGLWILVIVLLFGLRFFELRVIRPRNRRLAAEASVQAENQQSAALYSSHDVEEDVKDKHPEVQRIMSANSSK
ncbi:MFS transporter, ACS family, pantothenate transporter, partial [Tremellales sp. Uapishka_1]